MQFLRSKRLWTFISFIIILVLMGFVTATTLAPAISDVKVADCLQSSAGDCVRFPIVTGENIDAETLSLPQAFTGDLNFVIVPFTREQQEAVIKWLPFVQELHREYPSLNYYNVAILPDLAPAVRFLVSSGMNMATSDPEVRKAVIIVYLEDQEDFTAAMGIADLDSTRVFLLNSSGEVLWQESGIYSDELADRIREQIAIHLKQ